MATIWITYSWVDNENQDVDFVAQEIRGTGLTVKLDRWNVVAGRRLWEQIDRFITDPRESDAWLLVATNNSLESEPCKEEFAYALGRALKTRGGAFPVIALFLGDVDHSLIPAGIGSRLHVSIIDPDWKERIAAAASGRSPSTATPNVDPFVIRTHERSGSRPWVIEIRPRADTWSPFFAAIPIHERGSVEPKLVHGPRDSIPTISAMILHPPHPDPTGEWWVLPAGNQASPTMSYFLSCANLPTKIAFGNYSTGLTYEITLRDRASARRSPGAP